MKKFSALFFVSLAIAAQAHVPFLKPNQFDVQHDRLQIESSFTEFPFQADFAMDAPNFVLVKPDGTEQALTPTAKTRAAVYLEPQLQTPGSYRISTGVRKGPNYQAIETAQSKLYFADDMKRVAGKPTTMQYYNRADAYIFKGDTSYSPRPFKQGAEIIPLSSPHRLHRGDKLSMQVLKDGLAAANARIIVVADGEHFKMPRTGDLYDVENIRSSNIVADAQGRFEFSPQTAGLNYLFVTLHDKTSAGTWVSQNAGLTLEVLPPRP